jgi:hypothetical protein
VTIDKISGKKLILRYVNAIPAAVGKVFETTLLAQAVLRGNSGSTTPPRNTWSSCNAAANSPTSRQSTGEPHLISFRNLASFCADYNLGLFLPALQPLLLSPHQRPE